MSNFLLVIFLMTDGNFLCLVQIGSKRFSRVLNTQPSIKLISTNRKSLLFLTPHFVLL